MTKFPSFCYITPLLKYLHWLPVRYRNKFKLWFMTYQALISGQAVYIRNMLQPSPKVKRTLRFSELDQLHVPLVRTMIDSRAFSVATRRLWNGLPLKIRSAKTQISFRRKWERIFLAQTTNAHGFVIMSQITIIFVAPLSSDHWGFSRYRSLLLLLLLLILLLLSILLCIKSVTLLDSTFSRLQLITDFFVPRPSWILQYILLSKVGDCF